MTCIMYNWITITNTLINGFRPNIQINNTYKFCRLFLIWFLLASTTIATGYTHSAAHPTNHCVLVVSPTPRKSRISKKSPCSGFINRPSNWVTVHVLMRLLDHFLLKVKVNGICKAMLIGYRRQG